MDPTSATLWRFIRGDLAVADFEAWLYARPELEGELGEALYMDLVSLDYRDRHALFAIRARLDADLRPALACECPALADMAFVPMGFDGLDQRVFATVRELRRFGPDRWWLGLHRCDACAQHWMVAQEERIYDASLMRRLTDAEAGEILDAGRWPEGFADYEQVLRLCRALGRPFRFDDPLADTLVFTAQDLRKARPDITPEDIADLLGLSREHAEALLAEAGRRRR